MPTIDQAIAACEANEADALCGRIDWSTFKARRETLEAQYRAALSELSIRTAKRHAEELRAKAAQ